MWGPTLAWWQNMSQGRNLDVSHHASHWICLVPRKLSLSSNLQNKGFQSLELPDRICIKGFQDLHTETSLGSSLFEPLSSEAAWWYLVLGRGVGVRSRKMERNSKCRKGSRPRGSDRMFPFFLFALSLKASLPSFRTKKLRFNHSRIMSCVPRLTPESV